MRPIAIFRFSSTEGPGYFGQWLEARGFPAQLIKLDQGDAVPADVHAFSGVAMMGGPMSANDSLAWMPALFSLIEQANDQSIPMLGHCLGGQLLAKALGGAVTVAPTPEIGWGAVEVIDANAKAEWFGGRAQFTTFQWHFDTFAIPPGAMRVLANAVNPNQAYVYGPHIGFQCHIEMTRDLVLSWCESGARDIDAHPGPAVQSVADIKADLDRQLEALRKVADDVYTRWSCALVSR